MAGWLDRWGMELELKLELGMGMGMGLGLGQEELEMGMWSRHRGSVEWKSGNWRIAR